jgi:hypothetical protein
VASNKRRVRIVQRTVTFGCTMRGYKPAIVLLAWSLSGMRLLLPDAGPRPLRRAAVGAFISTAEPVDDHLMHRRSVSAVPTVVHGPRSATAIQIASSGMRAPAHVARWPIVSRLKIPPSSDDGILPS